MDLLDTLLLPLFQLTGDPGTDFFVGTALLALFAAALGEATVAVIYLSNRTWFEILHEDLLTSHEASLDAARDGDRESYQQHNRAANRAFGKTFAVQLGLAAGSLWPVFFALAFLHGRFTGMTAPLAGGWNAGAGAVFVAFYLVARIVLSRVKYSMPSMQRLKVIFDHAARRARESGPSLPPPSDNGNGADGP